jgi:malate dehydrogenase (oxaloacetate-decarboxylating)
MAEQVDRPIIFPLSNPTANSEATAQDLVDWTDGRALIGTGSPFPPVPWEGRMIPIDQTNNAYIFPGMGLGILASGARRVSDAMFMVAAKAVVDMSPAAARHEDRLLPPIVELRAVALAVAKAVARQARADGLADPGDPASLDASIEAFMWTPRYLPYEKRPDTASG